MKVNILGTVYRIERHKREEDPKIFDESDGYVDTSTKLIVVEDFQETIQSKSNLKEYAKQVIRHEIIHAFLFESGLDASSLHFGGGWATNEELVDWIAVQAPKLMRAFQECDCL